jgi:hypothetical protein
VEIVNESAAVAGILAIVLTAYTILVEDHFSIRDRVALGSSGLALMFASFLQI